MLRSIHNALTPPPSTRIIPLAFTPILRPRCFSHSPPHPAKHQLPARLKLDNADLTVSYLKGSGPGGQKINKTNSAVQIIHKPTGLVVKSQATRSRSQNEKIARELLADRVEHLNLGEESRTSIKAERAKRRKASKVKKSRRKYRGLEEGEGEGDEEGEWGEEEGEEVGEVESAQEERSKDDRLDR